MQLRAAKGPHEQILRRLVPPQHKKLLQSLYPLVPGWHLKGARFAGELSSDRPVKSVPHTEHRSQVQAAALGRVLKHSAALRGLPLLSPRPNAHGVVDNIWQLEGSGKGFYAQLKAVNFCSTTCWRANGRDGWANAAAELQGLSPLSRFFLFQAFKKKGSQPWQTDWQFSTGVSMPADSDNPDRIVLYVVKPQWAASVAGKAPNLQPSQVEDAAEQLTAEHLEQNPSQHPDVLRVCGAHAVEFQQNT
jgi:hypothetical protein